VKGRKEREGKRGKADGKREARVDQNPRTSAARLERGDDDDDDFTESFSV